MGAVLQLTCTSNVFVQHPFLKKAGNVAPIKELVEQSIQGD